MGQYKRLLNGIPNERDPMSWIVQNNRVMYSGTSGVFFPSSDDIARLSQGLDAEDPRFDGMCVSPSTELNIRFSKLPVLYRLVVWFSEESQRIKFAVVAKRGNREYPVSFSNSELPDSFVFEETWYSAKSSCEDIVPALKDAGITGEGSITLRQYAQL